MRRYSFGSAESGARLDVSEDAAAEEYSGMGGTDREDEDTDDADASDEGVGEVERDMGRGIAVGDAELLTSESSTSMCSIAELLVFFEGFECRDFAYEEGGVSSAYELDDGAGFSTT
jgi:hypothetical protein